MPLPFIQLSALMSNEVRIYNVNCVVWAFHIVQKILNYPRDKGIRFLRNVGNKVQINTASRAFPMENAWALCS
jgi:hypothetical protein